MTRLSNRFGLLTLFLRAGLVQAQTAAPPAFDVASIRPSPPAPSVRMDARSSPGSFNARYISLRSLIYNAYDVKAYQVDGVPSWAASDLYDIAAKAESGIHSSPDLLKQMLQTLLADRIQLKIHRETRELSVYALVVGKHGAKLKKSTAGADAVSGWRGTRGQLTFENSSMTLLTDLLTGILDRPVLDKTRLTGSYDFKLEWAADESVPDSNMPSIFTAVQERLGLKLESIKSPVAVIVIDHAERPSQN
jgi:uncharacterized protein (TIGR03435 family)